MYDIISQSDNCGYYTVLHKNICTLTEARDLRYCNGDLVVYGGTNKVVRSDMWLCKDWLEAGYETYALRKIKEVLDEATRTNR